MKLTTIHTNIQTQRTSIEHALSFYIMTIIICELANELHDQLLLLLRNSVQSSLTGFFLLLHQGL
jgi:hypothetical protein